MNTKPLTEQTPVEIDTALAALYYEGEKLAANLGRAIDSLHYTADDKRSYRYGRGNPVWAMSTQEALAKAQAVAENADRSWEQRPAKEALARFESALAARDANLEAQREIGKEFTRRGCWTRAFLVRNGDGHVHSSMNCSTCNRGQYATSFAWMVEYSGKDEAEIVDAAGWRACTVCYPSAPVGNEKSLPTKMFSQDDKDKAAAKAEREAAKVAREAKRVANAPTKSGEALTLLPRDGRSYGETFQTERSAMIYAVQQVAYRHYGYSHDEAGVKIIAQAVADKRGVEVATVLAEIETKGKKKAGK